MARKRATESEPDRVRLQEVGCIQGPLNAIVIAQCRPIAHSTLFLSPGVSGAVLQKASSAVPPELRGSGGWIIARKLEAVVLMKHAVDGIEQRSVQA